MTPSNEAAAQSTPPPRRSFFTRLATAAMIGGLVAGYGAFALVAGRFLYPARSRSKRWLFVATVAEFRPGDSIQYRAPDGAHIAIARQGRSGRVVDFVALSSTCPHLGCQVHWQGPQNRFFCPCHNGTFDPSGKGTGGPPGEAGQSLPRYRLKIDSGILYIEVPTQGLASAEQPRNRRES